MQMLARLLKRGLVVRCTCSFRSNRICTNRIHLELNTQIKCIFVTVNNQLNIASSMTRHVRQQHGVKRNLYISLEISWQRLRPRSGPTRQASGRNQLKARGSICTALRVQDQGQKQALRRSKNSRSAEETCHRRAPPWPRRVSGTYTLVAGRSYL